MSEMPIHKTTNNEQQQICANDSYILDKLLDNYNRHKIPGGKVEVMVEVNKYLYIFILIFNSILIFSNKEKKFFYLKKRDELKLKR